ncbi:MAG: type VI secretion system baseplate subunit TssG [Saccharospirillum sp.]|uniref:type VI secretion system baseplate subunit TssG n=1 Tax=Saccharospirillum sp. TaxID=2033801 RepID=UPI00329A510E
MEPNHGPTGNAVNTLVEQATRFHFHQLVEAVLAARGESAAVARPDWLRLRPSDWLSFPASDVRRVSRLPGNGVEIETTFFGFYGVDAPLPQYFLEDVTHQDDAGQRIQAFLDVFNNQAYWLLHQGWRKFELLQQVGDQNLLQRTSSALLGGYHRRHQLSSGLPGALAAKCRSAAGVESVLQAALSLPELDIDTQVLTQVRVDQVMSLDGSQALGRDTLLGQTMSVMGRHVRVQTGEVNAEQGAALNPGGELGQRLNDLLDQYLPSGVGYDVHIRLPASERLPMQLGTSTVRLGQALVMGEAVSTDCTLVFTSQQYKQASVEPSNPLSKVA